MSQDIIDVVEQKRLNEAREAGIPWKKWGPYLSERQWGTVREDYSDDGNAWDYFSHDQSRSRAYRWGEDGLGGHLRRQAATLLRPRALERARPDPQGAPVRPHQQRGQPRRGRQGVLLLRRLHADALVHEVSVQVSRSASFPIGTSSRRTARRTREEFEYELLDTGVFDDDRYFDVFVEYAKAGPDDILIRITVHNRGPGSGAAARAADAVVPQHVVVGRRRSQAVAARGRGGAIEASHPELGDVHAVVRRRAGAAVHREREQRAAALGPAERRHRTSRTRSTAT